MPSFQDVLETVNINKSTQIENISKDIKQTKKFVDNNELIQKPKNQIKSTFQTKVKLETLSQKNSSDINKENITSFEDLINLSSKKKEIELKYDLERNVNLIKFSEGKIDIGFNENLNKNFVRNLSEKLLEWTGKRWVISLTKEQGQKTFLEQANIKKEKLLENEKKNEVYKKFNDVFSDLELVDVKDNKKE